MSFRAAVVTFPGSNCDRDLAVALEKVAGAAPLRVWHGDAELPDGLDFIALPGGFSYGDYLRSGAMAARSPIMQAVNSDWLVTTVSATVRHTNACPALRISAPGSSPASVSTWKPLQIPSTGTPRPAAAITACMIGLRAAIAPERK